MMEPKRLLDARGAPEDMLRLLRAARREVPPPGLRASTWQGLVARSTAAGLAIGAAGTVVSKGTALAAAGVSGTSATASAQAIVSKGMLIWALKSAAICGGVGVCAFATQQALVAHSQTQTQVQAPALLEPRPRPASVNHSWVARPTPAQPTAQAGPEERQNAEPENPAATPPPPATVATASTGVTSRASTLRSRNRGRVSDRDDSVGASARLEAQRVVEVRQFLRQGDGRRALAALHELDRETTHNLLRQEREASKIDALVLLGNHAVAERLAQRFRQQYPNSPLATRWASQQRSTQ